MRALAIRPLVELLFGVSAIVEMKRLSRVPICVENASCLAVAFKEKIAGMVHRANEIGDVYGKLTVLNLSHVNTSGNAYWDCVCECGNHRTVCGTCLRDGTITACEFCSAKSRGEQRIHELLVDLGISHQTQYVMDKLRGRNGRRLPFDFAVFCDNEVLCLIEYQGAQHYIEVPYFRNAESLVRRQQTDKKKRQFCRDNNIRLIEIPY